MACDFHFLCNFDGTRISTPVSIIFFFKLFILENVRKPRKGRGDNEFRCTQHPASTRISLWPLVSLLPSLPWRLPTMACCCEQFSTLLKNNNKNNNHNTIISLKKLTVGNWLMVRWLGLCFHCLGPGSVPGWGTKIPHASGKTNKQAQ